MKFATPAVTLIAASGANAFVQNSPVRVKTSLASYLDDIGDQVVLQAPRASASGISNYLDSVPMAPSRAAGAGIDSYLESIVSGCDAVVLPSSECAEAISGYMGALSNGNAPASSALEGAKAIGSYLDNIAGQASARQGGAGIQSYLSTVATAPERAVGAGISNYLDSVGGGSFPNTQSAPAVKVSFISTLLG